LKFSDRQLQISESNRRDFER